MNETFERQLDRLMGESKAILSPPENPAIEKSNVVVNKICKSLLSEMISCVFLTF